MGFTQDKLAEISGLSIQTINDIEGGRKWVSDKTITRLSTALHIECFQLLMPDLVNQNNKETPSTKKILELMKKLKSKVNYDIEALFTDFLKI